MASRFKGVGVRICVPVRSDPFLVLIHPEAVKEECDACGAAVWFNPNQIAPKGIDDEQLWCNDCALNDPVVGPTLQRNIVPAIFAACLRGETHTWHVDPRDDTMDRGSDSS